MTIYQGDNTAAFGGSFLTINVSTESEVMPIITKAELKTGNICKTFENPTFPLTVDLTEEETLKLQAVNTAYLAVWDNEGRKKTCQGKITFKTEPRRV
jgi:hypothetical protein